jgi:hypothetical protein
MLYGSALLVSLYFDLRTAIYALVVLSVFEAITNFRIPRVVSSLRKGYVPDPAEGTLGIAFATRTSFEAERGWRLSVSALLLLSVLVYPDKLWFVPWFMAFAILGAGLSGVCPMFLAMKWIGLK